MSEASEIIEALDRSDNAIAEAVGVTRVAVFRARHEQTEGSRMLPGLRQLYALKFGYPKYVPPQYDEYAYREPDTAPKTEEELEEEYIEDSYDGYPEQIQPFMVSTTQLVRNAAKHILSSEERRRTVDSAPPLKQRASRKVQAYTPPQPSMYSPRSLAELILAVGITLFASPQEQQVLSSPPQEQIQAPTYVYTGDRSNTQLRLSQPATTRVSPLGHTSKIVAPEAPTYGALSQVHPRYKTRLEE